MKFNILNRKANVVTNYEGAKAFALTPETELYAAVATAGLSDRFYEKADEHLERIRVLIAKNDPLFVAKLAVYARSEMYLRSVPLVLAVELAKITSGTDITRKAVNGVVQRADEITELLACYQALNGRGETKKLNKLSKQLQKGLADAFNRFDEYQFAKYNRPAEVKLRDALFLVHPKAKNEAQQAIFDKIAAGELAAPYTWETELSALGQRSFASTGQKAAALSAKWEELIDSSRLGYMALLRNLRNILEACISAQHMEKVCAILADPVQVSRAKQLPFRFLAAYRELCSLNNEYVSMLLTALEDAAAASAANLKGFGAETSVVIACDVSGSMQQAVSPRSKILLYDIGLVLGMLLQSKCRRVTTGMFGNTWKTITLSRRNILSNVQDFYRREGEVGYATNGYKVIDDLLRRRIKADKIMLFTDCQLWDAKHGGNSLQKSWKTYKALFPSAKLYLFDLAGYGTVPMRVSNYDVHLIAGWSDKIFDVLQSLENGQNAVEKILQIELC